MDDQAFGPRIRRGYFLALGCSLRRSLFFLPPVGFTRFATSFCVAKLFVASERFRRAIRRHLSQEYFIRGRTFATSMDRGNPTLRSHVKKDQDRTNTPSNRTMNDRTKYPWNEDSSEDKKIERNAIHGSARGKRCHRSSSNQDTYFGRN